MTKVQSLSQILFIIQVALTALSAIPAIGPEAALATPFMQILQTALAAYSTAAGGPLDLSKIPLETPIP